MDYKAEIKRLVDKLQTERTLKYLYLLVLDMYNHFE